MNSKECTVKYHKSLSGRTLDPSFSIPSELCTPTKKNLQFSTILKNDDRFICRPISPITSLSSFYEKNLAPHHIKQSFPSIYSDQDEPKVEYSKYTNSIKTESSTNKLRCNNKLGEFRCNFRSKTKKRSVKEDIQMLEHMGYQSNSKKSFQFKGFLEKQSSSDVKLSDLWGKKQSLQVLKSANLMETARKLERREMTKMMQFSNRFARSPKELDELTYFKLLQKNLIISPTRNSKPNLIKQSSEPKLDIISSPKRVKQLKTIHKIITSCDKLFHESRNMQDTLYQHEKKSTQYKSKVIK